MDKKYDNNLRGAIFPEPQENIRSETDRHFSGSVEVEGKEYWVSAWNSTSKAGRPYISFKLTAKDAARPAGGAQGFYQQGQPQAQPQQYAGQPQQAYAPQAAPQQFAPQGQPQQYAPQGQPQQYAAQAPQAPQAPSAPGLPNAIPDDSIPF